MAKKVSPFSAAGLVRKPLFWLLVMTLLGGAFRFYNLNWDFKQSFHPDERNILGAVAETRRETGYKVTFFAYGQLPVYLYRATGELFSTPTLFWKIFQGREGWAEGFYWFFLLLVTALSIWFFPKEKFKNPSLGVSCFLFLALLAFKFYDVFSIWFTSLHDLTVKLTCLGLVLVVSAGISALVSVILEIEWVGLPFYSAAGATALLGFLPLFLPESVAQAFAGLAFTLLTMVLFLGLAWVSPWGRLFVGLFSLLAILASQEHTGRQYFGYGEAMIVGRWWSAFFSTATIVGTYFFVQRAFKNTAMALVAAAGFAFAAVSIEQAHYCITESFITFMFVAMLLCCYEITKEGSWKNYLLAGAAFGFALAAKTSALYYVMILVVAHLVQLSGKSSKDWAKEGRKDRENEFLHWALASGLLGVGAAGFLFVGLKFRGVFRDLFGGNTPEATGLWLGLVLLLFLIASTLIAWGIKEFKALRAQIPEWIKLAAAGALSFYVFFLLCPWSLLDYQGFIGRQQYEWSVVSIADACYVLQFKDTLRYWFHLQNLMHVELWWPFGVPAVLGAVWVLGRFFSRLLRPTTGATLLPAPFLANKGFAFSLPELLVVAWVIPYFGFIGSWNTKFIRYMAPLIPAFCIFGAFFLITLTDRVKSKTGLGRFLRPLLLAFSLGGSFLYSMAYMSVYAHPQTWIEASVWIYKNVPAGAAIVNEVWGDGLPVPLSSQTDPRMDRAMGPEMYKSVAISPYETHGYPTDDSPTKKNSYVDIVQKGDYISVSSKKLWYTLTDATPEFRPHGFNIYPVTSRYYRLLWSGLLGYKMVADIHSFPSLFGWEHPDEMAEESFSVYDHPRVYLFKKVEDVPAERILKLLSSDEYVKGIDRDLMRGITPANVDGFIADRKRYIEEKGLAKVLEEAAPTPVPTLGVAASKPPPPVKPSKEKSSPKKSVSEKAQPLPTPEVSIQAPLSSGKPIDAKTRQALQDLVNHPVVENDVTHPPQAPEGTASYQWRAWFSWLFLLLVLGWLALPLTLRVFSPIQSGAFSLSKILGFFVFAWIVWFFASLKIVHFTLGTCWVWLFILALISVYGYWKDRKNIRASYSKWGRTWWIQEGAFVLAFALFTLVKIHIPHIHDPVGEGYNGGGEAGMDYGFLASVVRSETFPPQNMWMAGQPIGYTFYYGHLMMGILTKTLGLVPAVTYNLALITLFATIFSGAFGLAFAFSGRLSSGWIAGFLCALAGNPAGAWQFLRTFQESFLQCLRSGNLRDLWMNIGTFFGAVGGVLGGRNYDYFGPTRVIPFGNGSGSTINEFPYFSVLYGDMHAHTLAMPFAMLLIGVIGSLFLSGSSKGLDWNKDGLALSFGGFLLGGMAFLNTWEMPVWLLFLGAALLVRTLAPMEGRVLFRGLSLVVMALLGALTLLGWWLRSGLGESIARALKMDLSENALGGSTGFLILFMLLGLGAAIFILSLVKSTRGMAGKFLWVAVSILVVLATAGLLWTPFFANFVPQQNKVMWVKPDIRTNLWNFFGVHGFFLWVLLLSFTGLVSPKMVEGSGKVLKKRGKFRWGSLADKALEGFENFLSPGGAVRGMMGLGIVTLLALWGASWVHWVENPGARILSQIFATLTAGLLVLAIWYRNHWGLWMAWASAVLLWFALLVIRVIPLAYDSLPFLGLWLFSVLWLLAFFHLGLCVHVFKDRKLSFSYLLVSAFFFVTATLEIFVMSEYFGFGDGMRNNSMFKYGIVAWTLASVASGIFLPRVLDFVFGSLKEAKRESREVRIGMNLAGGLFLWILIRILLDAFLPSFNGSWAYVVLAFLAVSVVVLAHVFGWVGRLAAIVEGVVLVFCLVFSSLQSLAYDSALGVLQRGFASFSLNVLLPGILTAMILCFVHLALEGRKDSGRTLFIWTWGLLGILLLGMISLYPWAASLRKCHNFTDANRRAWLGYLEPRTLNGLEFMDRENPADAAAIRFLNDRIPDQPCLAEFVGEGYNSWASRFSIFSGVPALMGWDGHVGEWVGARQGDDIRARFNATERIFKSTDPVETKKYLDAYGVRLVMVGTVERHGVPGRKGGYPPEGLSKFEGFLPLIYKNPEVEIFYNPPSDR